MNTFKPLVLKNMDSGYRYREFTFNYLCELDSNMMPVSYIPSICHGHFQQAKTCISYIIAIDDHEEGNLLQRSTNFAAKAWRVFYGTTRFFFFQLLRLLCNFRLFLRSAAAICT